MNPRAIVLIFATLVFLGFCGVSAANFGYNSSPGFQIGSTYQDLQHNARMARQIVVGGGWVHNIWTHLPGPSTANRAVQYYAWQIGGPGVVFNANVDSSIGAGYSAIDFDPTNVGAAVVGYHHVASGGTRFSRDTGVGVGAFSLRYTFPAANCQGIVSGSDATEGLYYWPVIATDVDGSGNGVVHAVSTESPATASDVMSIIYYRSNSGITGVGATCGIWIDSVDNIAATVVADPNSDNVAIVYLVPADYAFNAGLQQHNQDVVYRESIDLGESWGPVINVSNYTGADPERAYSDVSAMYTSDGCLHIAWVAANFDSSTGSSADDACKLRHWDDCGQCISTILNAQHAEVSCDRGSWQNNIARVNLTECEAASQKNLYATYTYFLGSDTGIPGPSDCSMKGYANGELFMQVSSTDGLTWGPQINLTNTASPGCNGDCASENWSSSAMYVTDSLRLQYLLDLDAGRVSGAEGSWTNNPIMNMAVPCVAAAPYASISINPAQIVYPEIYLMPDSVTSKTLTLTNAGNFNTVVTRKVEYLDGNGWLSFPDLDSVFVVPAGCANAQSMTMVVTAPHDEGNYDVNVHFIYDNGAALDTATLSFRLWDFCPFIDDFSTFRTTCNRLEILRTARARDFYDYSDSNEYLYDASLILGNGPSKLCWSIYKDYENYCRPTFPAGHLFGLSGFYVITNENDYPSYCKGSAYGRNDDSTLGYSVDFYAPKHPDSCDFFVASFKIYKGANDSLGVVSNLTVGFACDWDAPADTGSDNTGGFDAGRQMLYQRGLEFGPTEENYGAVAAYRDDGVPIVGGFIWDSPTHVYPTADYVAADLWNQMESLSTGEYTTYGLVDDLSSVLTIYRDASINGATHDTLKFVVILAAENSGPLTDLKHTVDKAISFVNNHGIGTIVPTNCCLHGDADNSGFLNISDVVYLINYIFVGGPAPVSECEGDNNCDCVVSISDAVYSIIYIFGGGQPPPQCCPGCIYDW